MKKRKLDTNEFGKPNFIKNKRKYSRHSTQYNSSPSTSSSGLKVNILRKRQNIRVLDEREILPVGVPIPACKHGHLEGFYVQTIFFFRSMSLIFNTKWFKFDTLVCLLGVPFSKKVLIYGLGSPGWYIGALQTIKAD